jgi:hypothetical protein
LAARSEPTAFAEGVTGLLAHAQIRGTLGAQPFRPFTMRLVDGREDHVPRPEFLSIPPNMRHTVFLANAESHAVTTLDAILFASITLGEDTAPPGRPANGDGAGRP